MTEYARQFVASTAALALPTNGGPFKANIARQFLPYCVAPVGDRYILLNREYKPLGWPTRRRGFLDYTDPQFSSMLVFIDHTHLAQLPWRQTENGRFSYLYGTDGVPAPWESAEAAAEYVRTLTWLLGCKYITREGCEEGAA